MIRRDVFHVSAAGYAGAQNLGARRANGPHIDGCRCLTCHIDAQVRERLEGRDDERETLQAHAADAPLRVNTGVLGLTGAGRASFARDDDADAPLRPTTGVLA